MKRYKVIDILRLLRDDGWVLLRTRGSHLQFAHPTKSGIVTVSYHSSNDDLHPRIIKSIFKQAGFEIKG